MFYLGLVIVIGGIFSLGIWTLDTIRLRQSGKI